MANQQLHPVTAPAVDEFFFSEMMAHPALFTHNKPQKVAIIGDHAGILAEVLKHATVTHVCCVTNQPITPAADSRVSQQTLDAVQWLAHEADAYDIIINTKESLHADFHHYFRALKVDGILLQSFPVSLLDIKSLEPAYQALDKAGFHDWQLLTFPQPSFGTHVAIMAIKSILIKQVSEKTIFNRGFKTQYYNYDVHKAALALPQFACCDGDVQPQ